MARALRLECMNVLYQITSPSPGDGRKDAGTGLVVRPLDLHGLETDEVRGGRGERIRVATPGTGPGDNGSLHRRRVRDEGDRRFFFRIHYSRGNKIVRSFGATNEGNGKDLTPFDPGPP